MPDSRITSRILSAISTPALLACRLADQRIYSAEHESLGADCPLRVRAIPPDLAIRREHFVRYGYLEAVGGERCKVSPQTLMSRRCRQSCSIESGTIPKMRCTTIGNRRDPTITPELPKAAPPRSFAPPLRW